MSRVDNITLKIILLIVILIVFFRTMSVRKTRELKEFLNKILQSDLSELFEQKEENKNNEKSEQRQSLVEANERVLKLDEETKNYIIRTILKRNYQRVRERLERMGYTNVRIQKVRSLIIIEANEGKTVLTISESIR